MLHSFLRTGLLPPWLGLFLDTLFFLLLYQMGFFSWFLFLQFRCWYTGMPLISEYWLCIQVFCQIHLLGQVVFWWSMIIFSLCRKSSRGEEQVSDVQEQRRKTEQRAQALSWGSSQRPGLRGHKMEIWGLNSGATYMTSWWPAAYGVSITLSTGHLKITK